MLNYNVKGTGLQVSDEIRTYIEKRLPQAEKLLHGDSTAHVDVELEYQTSEDRKKYRAEFTLSCGGEVYRADETGDTLHEAIDLAVEELKQSLGRTKEKQVDTVRRSASKFKDFIRGFRRG